MCAEMAQQAKKNRAFRAYIELMDAADWMRGEMSDQLKTFNLTMMQFRVLETLFRNGPQHPELLSRRFECSKQNIANVLKGLEKWGAIQRSRCKLPSFQTKRVPQAVLKRAGLDWRGRWVMLAILTPTGKRFIANVTAKHKKVVKAWMRVLDAREQKSLARICRKLRKGDIVKFVKDIRTFDREAFYGMD